jgi:alpha-glucosidase (family GH31 glycosyl hydrolase)
MPVSAFLKAVAFASASLLTASRAVLVRTGAPLIVPRQSVPQAAYAPWAHSHQVWLSSDRSNQANVTNFVQSWLDQNFTVGAIDVDSQWATGDNTFVPDTTKFPNFTALVSDMHDKGINVITWAVSMVDTDSPNFNFAMNNSYFIANGFKQPGLLKWWHGTGGLLDYWNPEAKAWWEKQMDVVLSTGIDGFKVDGTDPYLAELVTPRSPGLNYSYITLKEYQNQTYGHFFNYTRQVNGDHCMIWSRPVDSYSIGGSNATDNFFLTFSPKYVMTSGWVGDQEPTFMGLKDALINMFESAWQNYANFGSDTGGYKDGAVRTGELLLRWAQVNAFMPLFENGGDGEHRPFIFDQQDGTGTFYTDGYRRLVAAHYELGPYLLTLGTDALANNFSAITPISAPPADFPFPVQPNQLTDYSYLLGQDFYVFPIVETNMTSIPVIQLPPSLPGSEAGWYEFWNPSVTYPANATLRNYTVASAATSVVFARTGSIIPLHVSTPLAALHPYGDESFATAITAVVHSPSTKGGTARVYGWKEESTELSYSYISDGLLEFAATPFERDLVVVVRGLKVSSAAEGVSVIIASSTCSSESGSAVAAEVASLRTYDISTFKPASVSLDAAGPRPLRAIQGLKGRLESAAKEAQPCSYSVIPSGATSEDGSALVDVVVRAGAGQLGVKVAIKH